MFSLAKRRIAFQMQLHERGIFNLARRIKSESICRSYKGRDYDRSKEDTKQLIGTQEVDIQECILIKSLKHCVIERNILLTDKTIRISNAVNAETIFLPAIWYYQDFEC